MASDAFVVVVVVAAAAAVAAVEHVWLAACHAHI